MKILRSAVTLDLPLLPPLFWFLATIWKITREMSGGEFKWKVNEEFVKLNVYCLYINPSQYMTASGTSGDMEIMDENI